MKRNLFTILLTLLFTASGFAQLTLPPGGGNQKSKAIQYMGALAYVKIIYNSPDVTSPAGQDRTGEIWGNLVPYGLTTSNFGLGNPAPWRAGANENTVIHFSHDVLIQGQALAAGTYGFHVIPEEEGSWTIIFSNNSTAWGSYFYVESEDALRVETTPEENSFHEWLTYEFTDRQADACTIALMWENLSIPFRVEVVNMEEVYLTQIRKELQNSQGFTWQNWNAAANYCVQNDVNMEEALTWAQNAVSLPFTGQENFTTLTTLSQVQMKLGQTEESTASLTKAIEDPSANSFQIHQLGRTLIGQGNAKLALSIFETNYERFEGAWPTEVGMARGLSAVGNYQEAIKHARVALEQAPDDLNKNSLTQMIATLSEGKDVN